MKKASKLSAWLILAVMALLIGSLASLPFIAVFLSLAVLSLLPQPEGSLKVVVSNPLIGKSKKSMGNATFSTWKGINVLKEKATSVANPKTDAQLSARAAFGAMVEAFREMPSAIRAGFKKLAVKQSEFNAFLSYNVKNAMVPDGSGGYTFTPANALISKGTIGTTPITSATADRSANSIDIVWPTTHDIPGQSATDKGIMAAYNITQQKWTGVPSTHTRADGGDSMILPADWATGDTLRVYLGFYNPLSGESSDSASLPVTIVA